MILEKVEELCKQEGISIARLERECNLGNATIRRWDEAMPQADTLRAVARHFNVPMEYFFDDDSGKEAS